MNAETIQDWFTLVGSVAGFFAVVWHVRNWRINRQRRERLDGFELNDLETQMEEERRSHQLEKDRICREYNDEVESIKSRFAGTGAEGRVVELCLEAEERARTEEAKSKRQHETKMRKFELQIERIKNRPFD